MTELRSISDMPLFSHRMRKVAFHGYGMWGNMVNPEYRKLEENICMPA
jgi:hypothetical protein